MRALPHCVVLPHPLWQLRRLEIFVGAGKHPLSVKLFSRPIPTKEHLQKLAHDNGHRLGAGHVRGSFLVVVILAIETVMRDQGQYGLTQNLAQAATPFLRDLRFAPIRAALPFPPSLTPQVG